MASDRAREILAAAYEKGRQDERRVLMSERRQTPRRRVAVVLLDRLAERPQPAELMLSMSTEFGCSEKTIRRAAKEVGVYVVKRKDCWLWVHPKQAPPKVVKVDNQLAFSSTLGTFPHTA